MLLDANVISGLTGNSYRCGRIIAITPTQQGTEPNLWIMPVSLSLNGGGVECRYLRKVKCQEIGKGDHPK